MSYVRTPALETVRMNPYTGSIPGMTRAQAVRPLPGTAVLASRGALGTYNLDGTIDGRCNPHGVYMRPDYWSKGECLTTPAGEPVCKGDLAYWGTRCPSNMTQVDSGVVPIEDSLFDGPRQVDFSCCSFKSSLPPPAPKPAPSPTPTPKPATPPPPPPEPSAAPYAIGGLAALALIAGGIYWVTR